MSLKQEGVRFPNYVAVGGKVNKLYSAKQLVIEGGVVKETDNYSVFEAVNAGWVTTPKIKYEQLNGNTKTKYADYKYNYTKTQSGYILDAFSLDYLLGKNYKVFVKIKNPDYEDGKPFIDKLLITTSTNWGPANIKRNLLKNSNELKTNNVAVYSFDVDDFSDFSSSLNLVVGIDQSCVGNNVISVEILVIDPESSVIASDLLGFDKNDYYTKSEIDGRRFPKYVGFTDKKDSITIDKGVDGNESSILDDYNISIKKKTSRYISVAYEITSFINSNKSAFLKICNFDYSDGKPYANRLIISTGKNWDPSKMVKNILNNDIINELKKAGQKSFNISLNDLPTGNPLYIVVGFDGSIVGENEIEMFFGVSDNLDFVVADYAKNAVEREEVYTKNEVYTKEEIENVSVNKSRNAGYDGTVRVNYQVLNGNAYTKPFDYRFAFEKTQSGFILLNFYLKEFLGKSKKIFVRVSNPDYSDNKPFLNKLILSTASNWNPAYILKNFIPDSSKMRTKESLVFSADLDSFADVSDLYLIVGFDESQVGENIVYVDIFVIDENSNVIASDLLGFDKNDYYTKSEIDNRVSVSKIIDCIGDSLTAAGTYESQLQTLMGNGFSVRNFGVGGEGAGTIFGRVNTIPYKVSESFTIPQDVSPVEIKLKNDFGQLLLPLLQRYTSFNVNVAGVDGTLTAPNSSSGASSCVYYFTRKNSGSEIVVSDGENILISNFSDLSNHRTIIWVGQNGGFGLNETGKYAGDVNSESDRNRLFDMIETSIKNLVPSNFLIMSAPQKTSDSFENAMSSRFGSTYFNVRKFMMTNGLRIAYENGWIESPNPTEQDADDISNGKVPSSLRGDSVHFNSAGYKTLAVGIYDRIKVIWGNI